MNRNTLDNLKATLTDRVLSLSDISKCDNEFRKGMRLFRYWVNVSYVRMSKEEDFVYRVTLDKYVDEETPGSEPYLRKIYSERKTYDAFGKLVKKKELIGDGDQFEVIETTYFPPGSLIGETSKRFKVHNGGIERGRVTNRLKKKFVVYSGDQ